MGTDDKKVLQIVTEAMNILPDEKREYIIGYAEGVIAMANRQRDAAERPGA